MQSDSVLKVYCDGGARGNPGSAASAFVVLNQESRVIYEEAKTLGVATNNVAEYTAVEMAMEWLVRNYSSEVIGEQILIRFLLDSQLVVNQLNGLFKIKNQTLATIAQKIQNLRRSFFCKVTFEHIRRKKNTLADSLVNKALDALPISE